MDLRPRKRLKRQCAAAATAKKKEDGDETTNNNCLKSSKEIVCYLFQQTGTKLISRKLYSFLSPTLRSDPDILAAAKTNNIKYLTKKKSRFSKELQYLSTPKEILQKYLFPTASRRVCKYIWQKLDKTTLRSDRDLALCAISNGAVTACIDLIDTPFFHNQEFLAQAVDRQSALWWTLPYDLRKDPDFALSIQFSSMNIVRDILIRLPVLRGDRRFWTKICHENSALPSRNSLQPHRVSPSDELLADKDFVMDLCLYHESIFDQAHESLKNDKDFVQACLDKNPLVLRYVPRQLQLAFPGMIMAYFPAFHRKNFDSTEPQPSLLELLRAISPELWQNEDFRSAWFQAGGLFSQEIFDPLLPNCRPFYSLSSAERIQMVDDVRSNSTLYLRSQNYRLERGPVTDRKAHMEAFSLLSFGGCIDSPRFGLRIRRHLKSSNDPTLQRKLRRVYNFFCSQLAENKKFTKSILCAISTCNPDESPLALLNQGSETSMGYKRLIAEYAGIVTGEKLAKYQRAKKNLGLSFE